MRVICISESASKCINSNRIVPHPKCGDIDVVIDIADKYYYILEAYPRDVGYEVIHFIPLSEIDEVELVKERKNTLIKQHL